MIYYSTGKGFFRWQGLAIKCDGCGEVATAEVLRFQTDRLIATEWAKNHGWFTTKRCAKWIHLCPDCARALHEARRKKFVEENA